MSIDSQQGQSKMGYQNKMGTVRQDRIECDPERHQVKLSESKVVGVLDYSPFGIALETTAELGDSYQDCSFLVDDYMISQISISKIRSRPSANGGVVTAFVINGDPLDVEAVQSVKTLNETLNNTSMTLIQDNKLNEKFRVKVLEIKDILSRLESEINGLKKDTFANDIGSVAHYEDRISLRVSNYLSITLNPIYDGLKIALKDVDVSEIPKYFEYFRRTLGSIMYQSAYAHRAFHKPKGYAGDYEMMNLVYKRELRGETLFAKCLQRYFVDEPAGHAVRNREQYLKRKIKMVLSKVKNGEKIKILSVASGPAMELQNLFADPSVNLDNVEFHLLDQDLDALKHAQRKVLESARSLRKEAHLKLHNLSIKNIIQSGLPIKGFNLIYSAGLFDYFTDPVAMYAGKQLGDGLVDGGHLIIGNFSLDNPNQFAMGLIMDWNLIYRSEENMKQLFGSIGKGYVLEKEEQGINLFANVTK